MLSLYARYKEQGESFISQYLDFLAAGGSQAPQDLLGKLDIDVTNPDFWQGGCDLIRHNLKRARELANQTR